MKANQAAVSWDAHKKHWVVRIEVGGEVIKRAAQKAARDLGDELLRTLAVETAAEEGYTLDPAGVAISR